jgi:hypothetical protein
MVPGRSRPPSDADDLTDLTIAPKLRLWQGLEDKLKFSARMDLKLPIASDRHGLGTGNSDIGVVGIATYTIGKTSLDFNAGYYAINISRADFDDDRWFVGQTVRQALNDKWTPGWRKCLPFCRRRRAVVMPIGFLAADRNGPFAKTFLCALSSAPPPVTKVRT